MLTEITDSLVLKSKSPNFTRDSFEDKTAMNNYPSDHMDEGHISYCIADGKHYIFSSTKKINSETVILTGADRWTELPLTADEVKNYIKDNYIGIVDEVKHLTDLLATNNPQGRIFYVKENQQLYYNTYDNKANRGEQLSTYLQDQTGWFYPIASMITIGDLNSKIDNCIAKDEFNSSISAVTIDINDIKTNLDNYVSKSELEGKDYATKKEVIELIESIPDQPSIDDNVLKDYVKKTDSEYVNLKNSITVNTNGIATVSHKIDTLSKSITDEQKSLKEQINDAKGLSIAATAAVQTNLDNYIKGNTKDLNDVKEDIKTYKEFVEETYAKPSDISGLLNHYGPNAEYEHKWVGNEFAGDLVGKTGKEIASENYSYGAVFDQILFGDFTPKITQPSITTSIKPTWMNESSIEWYDEKNRIILLKAGSLGPDGADFNVGEYTDGVIGYPKGVTLANNYTNGLILQTDEKQSTTGFAKIQNKNGEWDYYRKDGNIYHVPGELEVGEYRYYTVSYFNQGSPVFDNNGQTISVWNENTPVEAQDYITINVSKPTLYNTVDKGMVENSLVYWTNDMEDYIELAPTCQCEQKISLPRQIKALYIWNGIAGGYAQVPMVNKKDKDGLLLQDLIPAYFEETIEDNGYYTYIYNSEKYGHRGDIKIKVKF